MLETSASLYYDFIVNTLRDDYSEEFCFQLCTQDQIIKTCGCANVFLPSSTNSSLFYCSSVVDSTCMKNVINTFGDMNGASYCKSACPFECNSIKYELTSFQSSYPTDYYSEVLKSYLEYTGINITLTEVRKSFTKVNIYYNNMEYVMTEQTPQMQVYDLFSNFGGTLGLFLGMSILTFAELIEIFFNFFVSYAKKYFNRRKKEPVSIDPQNVIIQQQSNFASQPHIIYFN